MSLEVRAIFHEGVFVPLETCSVPEGAEVSLTVQGPLILPPEVTDNAERIKILREVTDNMRRNPIPADAPPFGREEMHGRR